MAYDTIYLNPQGEIFQYEMDFAADLDGDAALSDIGSGSTITAYSSGGTDVTSTVLSGSARSAMRLTTKITPVTDGEDYTIQFLGKGATTALIIIKVLEVRSRRYITGSE